MVLIISENTDFSTKIVIDWLIYNNQPFVIVQPSNILNFKFIDTRYIIDVDGNTTVDIAKINSVWYRRGWLTLPFNKTGILGLDNLLYEERFHFTNFIYYLLDKKKYINRRIDNDINKLIALEVAQSKGLLIPKSYYNANKSELDGCLITKPIVGSGFFEDNGNTFATYTQMVDKKILPEKANGTYFQEKIKKKYELRVFYLHGRLWAMAIFSQKDNQTQVDFRHYNKEKPNRNVPFILPFKIKVKLKDLMQELNINSGSIDLIVTPENEYYFLEVNPIGQFSMISVPCNYKLEKEIAKYLFE